MLQRAPGRIPSSMSSMARFPRDKSAAGAAEFVWAPEGDRLQSGQEVGPFAEVERALILNVGDSLYRHSATPIHSQVGRAENMLSLELEPRSTLRSTAVTCDERLSLEFNDVLQNGFGIVLSVAGYGYIFNTKIRASRIEKRNGNRRFPDRIGFGDFP